MPIYVYRCSKCNEQSEVIQKFSDAPLKRCKKCKKNTLQKQITSGAFCLMGTGWYRPGMSVSKK